MHRSGTSAFARVFNLLGARLPDNLLEPQDALGNPLGFWEPERVVELHDQLLSVAGRTWYDLEPFSAEWFQSDLVQSYVSRLATVVQEEYARAPLFVLKDPRISRLVPLWQEVFQRLGVEPFFVIALRNPLEIAASHRDRDRFRSPLSLLLWLRHMLDAEHDTRGHRRVVVAYADLLEDWRPVVARVATELGLRWSRASRASELEIDDFLRSDARHHVVTDAELQTRVDVSRWVRDAYGAFRHLADGGTQRDLRSLDVIRAELDESEDAWGAVLFDAVHRLRAEREQASEELGHLRSETAALAEEISRQDAKLEETQKGLELSKAEAEPAKEEAGRLRERLVELENAMASLESERERLAAELDRLRGEITQRDAALAEAESAHAEDEGRLAQTTAELEAIQAELAESAAAEARLREQHDAVSSRLAERGDALARAEDELGRLTQELADREAELLRRDSALADQVSRVEAQAAELEQQSTELERWRAAIGELRLGNERLAERLAVKEHELARKAEELELFEAAQAAARSELETLRKDARTLETLVASGRIGTQRRRSISQFLSWLIHGRFALVPKYWRVRKSPEVDGLAYLLRNEDVIRAGLNPVMHYVEHGRREGRDAGPSGSEELPGERRATEPAPPPEDGSSPAPVSPAHMRWRDAVAGVVQRNLLDTAAVCLVQASDEDGVDLGPRRVWQFRADMDASRLVTEIEKARADGATHVLVTADALRLLDGRRGLGDYLTHYSRRIMRRDQDCALYFLAPNLRGPLSGTSELAAIVSAVVPPSQALVVIGSPPLDAARNPKWHIPAVEASGVTTESLDEFRAKGARYLVLAADQLADFEKQDDLRRYVESHYRSVLRREGVGVLYEAIEPSAFSPTSEY